MLRGFILTELAGAGEHVANSWLRRPRNNYDSDAAQGAPQATGELSWDYWKHHPRHDALGDVSNELEAQRRSTYDATADDFDDVIDCAQKHIDDADDIDQLEDAIGALGLDAYDMVADPTQFDEDVEDDDVDAVKSQLGQGLRRWSHDTLRSSEQNDFDTHALMRVLPK